jgi:PAS domain S-box-containing protein
MTAKRKTKQESEPQKSAIKRTQPKEMRQKPETFAAIAENVNDGIIIAAGEGAFAYANKRASEITGYSDRELLKMGIKDLVQTDEVEKNMRRYKDRLVGKAAPVQYELMLLRKDKASVPVELTVARTVWRGQPAAIAIVRDITERRRAEQDRATVLEATSDAMRDSEKRYRALVEQSLVGIGLIQQNQVVFANPAFLNIFGYDDLQEFAKIPVLDHVAPSSRDFIASRMRSLAQGNFPQADFEFDIVRKDGEVRTLHALSSWITLGGEAHTQTIFQDITERKQAEEALRQSEERYRTMLEEMEEGYYEVDIAGTFTFVNDGMSRILGYSRDELIGMNYKLYTPKEDIKPIFEAYNRVYRTGEPLKRFPMPEIRKDGTRIIAEDSVFPLRNERDEVIGFRGISRDITERKKAEEALRQSEERYRQLAENAGEAIFVVQDGVIKFINPKGAELSGYSIEELTSMPFVSFIHPNDIDMVIERNARRLRGESVPQIYDFRIMRKDGDIRWGELNAVPISWENRPAVLCFMSDITERKKAGEALRQSEERYRAILEKMEDSYSEVDLSGNITFINGAACRHLGYSREELMGMSYKSFTAEDYIKPIFQIFNAIYRTGVPNKGFRWRIIRKDASHWFIDASASPLRNDKGEIIGFSAVGRDITERMKMEEQLIITDRLASIGQLAAGIAHELNNPLTSVIGFSDLLLERDLPADVKEDLETVNREAKRAVNVIKGLLTFARQQRTEKSLVDINNIIQGVLQIRSYEQRVSNIEADARFAPALPQVMGNGVQLQQVFINIIVNAEQAMVEAHGRGKLTIVTEQVGDMVRASITDDGPGISPDNMKKLFTPFFTTREVGKGTGLGLSICHGIVTEHGGKLCAESKPGEGATFVVELPISKL